MNHRVGSLVVGIGSPHGDDQVGWKVVDALDEAGMRTDNIRLLKINSPVDLITELDCYGRVLLVDATIGLPPQISWKKLTYANPKDRELIQQIGNLGTHDLGLSLALRMAESLGKRVDHLTLWLGNGQSFDHFAQMSLETAIAVKQCATSIRQELCETRTITD